MNFIYPSFYRLALTIALICFGCDYSSKTSHDVAVNKYSHDLGLILIGPRDESLLHAQHSFIFQNPSKTQVADIVLQGKSCGCTDLAVTENKVFPGGQASISLTFPLRSESKRRRESALFATGLREFPTFEVSLACSTLPRISISPESVRSVELLPNETRTIELIAVGHRIKSEPKSEFSIQSHDKRLVVDKSFQKEEVVLLGDVVKMSERFHLLVMADEHEVAQSPAAEYSISWGGRQLTNRIFISNRTFVKPVPEKLYMSFLHPAGRQSVVSLSADSPFELTQVRADVPWLSFTTVRRDAGSRWDIQVEILKVPNQADSRNATLFVDLVHPYQSHVEVPIAVVW